MSDANEPDATDAKSAMDGSMRAALLGVIVTAAVLTALAFGLYGVRSGIGVAIGGTIAPLNLWVFAQVGEAFLSRRGATAPWAAIATVKLVLLLGGVWLILRSGYASGLQMIVGYSALPVGVTIGSLFGPKPPDDLQATGPKGSAARSDRPQRRSFGDSSDEDVLKARPSQPGEPPSEH